MVPLSRRSVAVLPHSHLAVLMSFVMFVSNRSPWCLATGAGVVLATSNTVSASTRDARVRHNKNNEPGRLHKGAGLVAPGASGRGPRVNGGQCEDVHRAYTRTQHRRPSVVRSVHSRPPVPTPRRRALGARVGSVGASASGQRRAVGSSTVSSIYGRGEAITPLEKYSL